MRGQPRVTRGQPRVTRGQPIIMMGQHDFGLEKANKNNTVKT